MLKSKLIMALVCAVLAGCSGNTDEDSFTVVVIPDTQNYVDYTLQKNEGFALDSAGLFIAQMEHVASKAESKGGTVAFVAAVGDVWQHVLTNADTAHFARGVLPIDSNAAPHPLARPEETRNIEIPKALAGYQLISDAGIPFGVAPGNHDYDAWWSVAVPNGNGTGAASQEVHIGGLDAFKSVFGSDTGFFSGKDWYISGYEGGGSSAQVFSAGGYHFLHLAFEMQAGDKVLAWAQGILNQYPGVPTLISTHDYLNPQGERKPSVSMNLAIADPAGNNSAEALWQKFIRKNDQILMVFSGHQFGAATRIDDNAKGHKVYQMLSDYQARGQAALDAGQPLDPGNRVPGVGDGWYRELNFHLDDDTPSVDVRTYSTHYNSYSGELGTYAQWYRAQEQPQMSDVEFLQADEFTLELDDFRARFGAPAR